MSARLITIFLLLSLVGSALGASAEFVSRPGDRVVSPARWGKRVIPIALSKSFRGAGAIADKDGDVEAALKAALDAWSKASGIEFKVSWTDAEAVSSSLRGDRINLITIAPNTDNLLLFAGESENPARTRIFTDRRGFIAEVDIVLNPYQQFSTDGTFGTYDLQSVVTHELGHLLGLSHSPMMGAVMAERIAKNGTFGTNGFASRVLTIDDQVGVRGLYGAESDSCCGSVSGRMSMPAGKQAVVWLEEKGTGRSVAAKYADESGAFRFDGLEIGDYVLRIDSASDAFQISKFQGMDVTVARSEATVVSPAPNVLKRRFSIPLTGFNDQFAASVPAVSSGTSQRVLFGAAGALKGRVKVKSTSPYVTVLGVQVFGGRNTTGTTVFAADVIIDPAAPSGDYTLVVSDGAGADVSLVGAVKVRKSPDFSSLR